jgi:hypothetical protein
MPLNLINLLLCLSIKNWTVCGYFNSYCHDLCNSLTVTASTEVPHAMFPEINPYSTEILNYHTEKRPWIQRIGAWVDRLQKVWHTTWLATEDAARNAGWPQTQHISLVLCYYSQFSILEHCHIFERLWSHFIKFHMSGNQRCVSYSISSRDIHKKNCLE